RKIAPLEVRSDEARARQVRTAQDRPRKRCTLEIGAGQVSAGQVAPIEGRAAQVAAGAMDGLLRQECVALLRAGAAGGRAHDGRRHDDGNRKTERVHHLILQRDACAPPYSTSSASASSQTTG